MIDVCEPKLKSENAGLYTAMTALSLCFRFVQLTHKNKMSVIENQSPENVEHSRRPKRRLSSFYLSKRTLS
jgi:hypothetical protein